MIESVMLSEKPGGEKERKKMKVMIHFLDGFMQLFKDVKYKYREGGCLYLEFEDKTIVFPLMHIRSIETED